MSDASEKTIVPVQHGNVDWFLQSLVKLVHLSQLEFGITLQVSGMLVSGNLVNGANYFEAFSDAFSSQLADDPETAKSFKELFAENKNIYKDEGPTGPLPQFIHLKDARFFATSGNPIPHKTGVLWRGRISEVGGFVLGSLSAER